MFLAVLRRLLKGHPPLFREPSA